jgi:hypothetical protein
MLLNKPRSTVRNRAVRATIALAAVAAFACRPAADSRPDTARSLSASTPVTTAHPFAVTDSGAGALRIGMTFAQAARALGDPVPDTSSADSACAYVVLSGVPAGVRLMWVSGHLARVEVVDTLVPTSRGVRVGDAATRVDSAYRGLVTVTPHKYDPRASYRVVRSESPADSAFRLVFETDSTQRVARYRAGREPEVEWVEGCA